VWANSWLGLFATYEGLALQLAALLAVVGSYVVAREVQVKAPQRRRARAATIG
jgi:high-affinity iron transporter